MSGNTTSRKNAMCGKSISATKEFSKLHTNTTWCHACKKEVVIEQYCMNAFDFAYQKPYF